MELRLNDLMFDSTIGSILPLHESAAEALLTIGLPLEPSNGRVKINTNRTTTFLLMSIPIAPKLNSSIL